MTKDQFKPTRRDIEDRAFTTFLDTVVKRREEVGHMHPAYDAVTVY